MDIKKEKPNSKNFKLISVVVFIIALLSFYFYIDSGHKYKVERTEILLSPIVRGDLSIEVDGYGSLRSSKQRLLTAYSKATVKDILLRPGSTVEPNSIIMLLNNPELEQEVGGALVDLSKAEAGLRRLKLNNKRELLAEKSSLENLKAQHQRVKLRLQAQSKLVSTGVISAIAYQEVELEENQLKRQTLLAEESIQQLLNVHDEAISISVDEVKQAKLLLNQLKQRSDELTVRAGIKGTLQRMSVELGQSLIAGQELALVGSNLDLNALIRVSQVRAEKVTIGQRAIINTRSEQVPGVVTRVASEVVDGTVEVEIEFMDGTPESARPELNVDAKIIVAELENTLYIERPTNVNGGDTYDIYRLNEKGDLADSVSITFGQNAGRYIQVLHGGNEFEQLVLSDMSMYQGINQIKILN